MQNSPHVQLAMRAIREYVRLNRVLKVEEDVPPELSQPAASFVSLKKYGNLRGCIGTIEPSRSTLAEEIIMNGISAATRDPRFNPVEPHELDFLTCSVDVLSPPEEISDIRLLDQDKYGVIVESGIRRGLLLPNLEGVSSVDQQLDIARQKAGIAASEPIKLYRFEVKRFF